jgi:PAS domain S-box-containing protein
MDDSSRTKTELMEEISALRKRIQELELSEAGRKRVEEELVVSRNRLSRAEIISRCGNWEFDLGSNLVFASDGARSIYGVLDRDWTIEEVQKIPLPEYRDMLDGALRGLINENRPYSVEFKIRRPDTGEVIDIYSVAEYDRRRNVVFGVVQDITVRTRAEEALLESEAKYRTVVESSLVGVYIIQDGLFRFVNRRWCEIYGYAYDEIVDKVSPLDLTPPEDKQLVEEGFRKRLSGEAGNMEYEVRAIRKDGRIIAVKILGSLMLYPIFRTLPCALTAIFFSTTQSRLYGYSSTTSL